MLDLHALIVVAAAMVKISLWLVPCLIGAHFASR